MLPANIEYTTIVGRGDVEVLGKLPTFITRSKRILALGWIQMTTRDVAEEQNEEEELDLELPILHQGDIAKVKTRKILELHTKPPLRFSEATLIAKLEHEGIGRPATYATILSNIKNRGYIQVKNKVFIPEPSAELIVDLLLNKFNFMEIGYTKKIEEELDEIATGSKEYLTVVTAVDTELELNLITFTNNTNYPCPNCQANMRRIKGKNGYFWGCSRFKEGCKSTLPDSHGRPGTKVIDLPLSEHPCPLCDKPLRKIKGKKGFFWSCSSFEKGCKFISDDYNGKPLKIFMCPKCNKRLRRLKGDKNFFWSCSGFNQGCETTFKDANGKPQFLEDNKE
jgi:DNA topoisomerase-1